MLKQGTIVATAKIFYRILADLHRSYFHIFGLRGSRFLQYVKLPGSDVRQGFTGRQVFHRAIHCRNSGFGAAVPAGVSRHSAAVHCSARDLPASVDAVAPPPASGADTVAGDFLYGAAQLFGLNFYGYPGFRPWFFSPFAWQLLFVIGASCGYPGTTHRLITPTRLNRLIVPAAVIAAIAANDKAKLDGS